MIFRSFHRAFDFFLYFSNKELPIILHDNNKKTILKVPNYHLIRAFHYAIINCNNKSQEDLAMMPTLMNI
jgi:hypothetical protein